MFIYPQNILFQVEISPQEDRILNVLGGRVISGYGIMKEGPECILQKPARNRDYISPLEAGYMDWKT